MENTLELSADFWDKFDFSGGSVHYAYTSPEEDMLLIGFPQKLNLYAGTHYDRKNDRYMFDIRIIWDNNFQSPVALYICKTASGFEKLIHKALEQIKKELELDRFSYYGPLWETIRIEL